MTTLTLITDTTADLRQPASDFVSTDTAALAMHMDHCASQRGRFFNLHAAFEWAHTVVFARMVTAAVLAVFILAVADIV